MNVETLKSKRAQSEEKFNSIQGLRDGCVKTMKEYDIELDRLRGEYRAYTELIEEATMFDPPATVVVEGELAEKKVTKGKGVKRGQK